MGHKQGVDYFEDFKNRFPEDISEDEFLELKREIRSEYEEKDKALNALWILSGGSKSFNKKPSNAGVMKVAREIINNTSGEFTSVTLREEVVNRVPNLNMTSISTTLSTLLRRMREKGEIEVVSSVSSPSNPYVYRKNVV